MSAHKSGATLERNGKSSIKMSILRCVFEGDMAQVRSLSTTSAPRQLAGSAPDRDIARGPSNQDRENPYSKDCLGNELHERMNV